MRFQVCIGRVDGNPKRQLRTTDERRFVRQRLAVIYQTVLANAQRIGLINASGFFFWIGPIDCFAARGIQRIISKRIRALIGLLFSERAGMKDAICVALFGIEVKRFRIRDQRFEIIGVFPFAIRAAVSRCEQVISDLILQELRLRPVFHRPVVPLPM